MNELNDERIAEKKKKSQHSVTWINTVARMNWRGGGRRRDHAHTTIFVKRDLMAVQTRHSLTSFHPSYTNRQLRTSTTKL